MVTALVGETNAWGTAVYCESRPASWALILTAVTGVGGMIGAATDRRTRGRGAGNVANKRTIVAVDASIVDLR